MAAVLQQKDFVQKKVRVIHARLMAHNGNGSNDEAIACMFATWRCGESALPDWMGLHPGDFDQMMRHHFPGVSYAYLEQGSVTPVERHDEVEELYQLLLMHRAGRVLSETWVARIIAIGCMGCDHLWQDLGLWSRRDLTELMYRNFPSLAQRNDKNMKWKKFLYKQLCETEGIYTCRSPSCEVCADYDNCFSSDP